MLTMQLDRTLNSPPQLFANANGLLRDDGVRASSMQLGLMLMHASLSCGMNFCGEGVWKAGNVAFLCDII